MSVESLKMERDAAIRSRDDYAAQVRVMRKRLQEAEEEQYKAEEDTASLRAELELLQRKEEDRRLVASSATSDQYYLLQQEVETLKVELQDSLRRLQEEQQTVANEQECTAKLMGELEQLSSALVEAKSIREGYENSINKGLKEDSLKEKDHQLRELASMVERLESGRQKLLAEIDAQSIEIERLFMENDSLAARFREASTYTSHWEHQVQMCLQENSNLRAELNDLRRKLATHLEKNCEDLLDVRKVNESSKLQVELTVVKGEADALRAQVLQLTSDLNHAVQHASSLNWLYKPILGNIEKRLQQLKYLRSRNQVEFLV
ncbi:hypothetical protein GOP47_0029855 [Adiantum capillus-veneris]|nr:hypothetical protein GOP47_0029855 [Adiantum capillus-veneris]